MTRVPRPNAFLVGAPRSGTTSLFTYLARHPSIGTPSVKEPHHFGRDLGIRLDTYSTDRRAYRELFRDLTQPVVLEASTSYLLSRSAAEEIAAFAPNAHILVNLRNPIDVILSLHRFVRSWGAEPLTDVLAAFHGPPGRGPYDRLRGMDVYLDYRRVVTYGPQLRRYLDTFGPDRVHVTLFDDLVTEPHTAVTAAVRSLGLDPLPLGPYEAENEAADVRSYTLQQLVVHPPDWLRTVAHAVVPDRPRTRAKRALVRLNRRPGAPRRVDPDIRRALARELAPVIDDVEALLGRALPAWRH